MRSRSFLLPLCCDEDLELALELAMEGDLEVNCREPDPTLVLPALEAALRPTPLDELVLLRGDVPECGGRSREINGF